MKAYVPDVIVIQSIRTKSNALGETLSILFAPGAEHSVQVLNLNTKNCGDKRWKTWGNLSTLPPRGPRVRTCRNSTGR